MDEGSDVGFISGSATNSSTSHPLSSTVKHMLFESPGQSTLNKRPIEKHVTTEIETLPKTTPSNSKEKAKTSARSYALAASSAVANVPSQPPSSSLSGLTDLSHPLAPAPLPHSSILKLPIIRPTFAFTSLVTLAVISDGTGGAR
ncbi:Uncharacterized protein Fot_36924 [Forsythia ovata]|uniref:Uncharacterized protein n=1 Tax=Forsythia ovata TaxID=205694 RepID=A0ABD1SQS3_9LAMI